MDYSAAVIPVTKASKIIDKFDKEYEPLNAVDRKNWEACKSKKLSRLRVL
jgi:amidase